MARYPYRVPETVRVRIPRRSAEILETFVNEGGYLSTFYFALLSGHAFQAANIADDENTDALGWMLALIAGDFPRACYGSAEAVRAWPGLRVVEGHPEKDPGSGPDDVEVLYVETEETVGKPDDTKEFN